MTASPIVAHIVRNGFVEGRHHGSVVALDRDGSVAWSVGEVDSPVLARSCNKPFQAAGMVGAGLDLPGELLALVGASHSAEKFHLDGVRSILSRAGLDESALQTPAAMPVEEWRRDEIVRAGGGPEPILMNCSGKHAGMLATCVANAWDVVTYRDPDHPLQRRLREVLASLTGVPVATVAVDGCGAPLFSTTLTGLARGFRRVATADRETPEGRVAAAYTEFPEWVSGTRRDEVQLLRAFPGMVGKAGAEGCYAVALPDGRAIALKIDDGAARARPVVMAAALRRSGLEHPVLDEIGVGTVPVLGGGQPVGAVTATL